MTATPLPTLKDVKDLLGGLLGREVEVEPCDPVLPGPDRAASVAIVVDERVHTVAVVVVDLPLSAAIGAALALLPPGSVRDAVRIGELTDALRENLQESLNVLTSLLNGGDAPHVRLYDLYTPAETLPRDVHAFARAYGRRLDIEADVPGYGRGQLSVVLAA